MLRRLLRRMPHLNLTCASGSREMTWSTSASAKAKKVCASTWCVRSKPVNWRQRNNKSSLRCSRLARIGGQLRLCRKRLRFLLHLSKANAIMSPMWNPYRNQSTRFESSWTLMHSLTIKCWPSWVDLISSLACRQVKPLVLELCSELQPSTNSTKPSRGKPTWTMEWVLSD